MEFSAEIVIAAPAARVWALLTDASRYPQWNTTVDSVIGTINKGGKITVNAKINPGRAFPLTVAEFDPPSRMVWSSGMPLGVFKGARTFTVSPAGTGVVFRMREVYTGPLAGMITKSIPNLQPAFDQFARDLKVAAEATA